MPSTLSSPLLKILTFSFSQPYATPQMRSFFSLTVANTGQELFSGKLVIDIYPFDQPEHPLRHFGYFAIFLELAPGTLKEIEGTLNWNGQAEFCCDNTPVRLADQWVGTYISMGCYRIYARILATDHELQDQAWLLQTLVPENEFLEIKATHRMPPWEAPSSENKLFCPESNQDAKHGFSPLGFAGTTPKNLLLVTDKVPTPDQDSGSLRLFEILKILSALGWKIQLFPMDQQTPEPYTTDVSALGVQIITSPCCHFMNFGATHLETFLKRRGLFFQIAWLSRPDPASEALPLLRQYAPRTRIIYDTVDLHFVREARRDEVTQSAEARLQSNYYREIEVNLCQNADITLAVTEEERAVLAKMAPGSKIDVIGNIHQIKAPRVPFESRAGLLFIGSFLHAPNEDAVLYFMKDIFPLVKQSLPEITLTVIGKPLSPALRKISDPNVVFAGHIRDITPFFEQARLFIAPLRYGAGLKGKIGMSMGYGLPVVTTSVGAEGFEITHGQEMMLADSAMDFAAEIIKLNHDRELWQSLSVGGQAFVAAHFSEKSVKTKIAALFAATLSTS